ncbi:hypothetical protein D3C87_855710 [compost metagenome]
MVFLNIFGVCQQIFECITVGLRVKSPGSTQHIICLSSGITGRIFGKESITTV